VIDPGRLYRRPDGVVPGRQPPFLVAHVARPPGGCAPPDRDGPVPVGWRLITAPDAECRALGPFVTDTTDG
jgi:hypothetical protein